MIVKKKKSKTVKVKAKSSSNVVKLENVKPRVRVRHEDFILRLTEKMTHFDANLILEAAMRNAGVDKQHGFFKKDETKQICLALIKRGGPAYSVGVGIYREFVG